MNEQILFQKQGDRCHIYVQSQDPSLPTRERDLVVSISLPKGGLERLTEMLLRFQENGVDGYSGSIRLGISNFTVTENISKVVDGA